MASEAVGGNMHMDTRVIKVADFKSEVKWPPRSFDVLEHHMPISHGPCRRRSIGPLPSCWNANNWKIRHRLVYDSAVQKTQTLLNLFLFASLVHGRRRHNSPPSLIGINLGILEDKENNFVSLKTSGYVNRGFSMLYSHTILHNSIQITI